FGSAAAVTVLDAAGRVGGCVWTERRAGFTVECGPNGFLDAKPSTARLCHDLGLDDHLVAASESSGRNRYLFLDRRLRPLPNGLVPFLRSPLLSLRGKLELLAEPLRPGRGRRAPGRARPPPRRRPGRDAAAVFAAALAPGVHGGAPALLDVRAAFPRLARLEADSGSVVRGLLRAAKARRAAGEKP